MDRAEAHQALVEHRPVPALLGLKCSVCRCSWPCPTREQALDELTGDVPLTASVLRQWSER